VKAAIYARVSTRDKDQDPELQLSPMRDHAAAAGWNIAEYVDLASASDYVRRVSWQALIADARRRRFQQIVVWKLDRAFRSTRECLNALEDLDRLGIGFLVLTQPEINTRSSIGRLILTVLAAVAEFERDLIHERVREGMVNARRRGAQIGRPAALSKPGMRRHWRELEPRVRTGELSRRAAARTLGVGLATVQRLLAADPKGEGLPASSARRS
jgi:DNA invertase Pin-like site-specific DNA recombinase